MLVMPSVARISASRSKGGLLNSVKTSPRTSTRTRSQISRSDSSSLHSSTPAPLVAATPARELSSSSFDATSTPLVGVIATMSDGRCASVRATVTFCWLPPDSSATGWAGPDDTRESREVNGAAAAARRRGTQQAEPAGQLPGDGHRGVLGHAEVGHEPSARRSSGM